MADIQENMVTRRMFVGDGREQPRLNESGDREGCCLRNAKEQRALFTRVVSGRNQVKMGVSLLKLRMQGLQLQKHEISVMANPT